MADTSRSDKIRALIQTVSGQAAPADEEESLFEGGLLDSFVLPDLVSALEQEFGITVPDNDARPAKFDSISRIEAYLKQRGV